LATGTITRKALDGQQKRRAMDGIEQDAESRLALIAEQISKAAARFGGPPAGVKLVAVSKTVPAERIRPFLAAGQRMFGENRVQEALAKWPGLRAEFPDVELHLIGPLQTNKVKEALALFDVIETVDRERLAAAIAAEQHKTGRRAQCFVQVNIGAEPQKSGVAVAETVEFVRRCIEVHRLSIAGLMCVPPEGVPAGPYFAQLATLARAAKVDDLSMGMSSDFEVGIAMGASHVRVGSLLFGIRPPTQFVAV
jgi:pyridoxal phosphate enzyme (YggS family)